MNKIEKVEVEDEPEVKAAKAALALANWVEKRARKILTPIYKLLDKFWWP